LLKRGLRRCIRASLQLLGTINRSVYEGKESSRREKFMIDKIILDMNNLLEGMGVTIIDSCCALTIAGEIFCCGCERAAASVISDE
jgi:hypothetical protein